MSESRPSSHSDGGRGDHCASEPARSPSLEGAERHFCNAPHPDPIRCNRLPGHDGDHLAHGFSWPAAPASLREEPRDLIGHPRAPSEAREEIELFIRDAYAAGCSAAQRRSLVTAMEYAAREAPKLRAILAAPPASSFSENASTFTREDIGSAPQILDAAVLALVDRYPSLAREVDGDVRSLIVRQRDALQQVPAADSPVSHPETPSDTWDLQMRLEALRIDNQRLQLENAELTAKLAATPP